MLVSDLARLHALVPSLINTVRAIYAFYKRRCRFKEIMTFNPGLDRNHYISLVTLSFHVLIGITIGTVQLVRDIQHGASPWVSWADTHSNYSRVIQITGFTWKNDPASAQGLEKVRWSLVVYAFQVFSSLGFTRRTRQNYRHAFTSLASRFNHMTSSGAP
jgi:pheromone a factor receptor